MTERKTALAFMAHPDDAEFTASGTLALLREKGWEIHIATMTAGDCGSETLGPEEIRRIRIGEATRAAAVLAGAYHHLECRDGFIAYDPATIVESVRLVRAVRPRVVFAASPSDYLIDHEVASALVRNAAFFAGVPNLRTEPVPPFRPVPYLYYADAVEGKDPLGRALEPTVVVDVTGVIEVKKRMLACHESQREWLQKQHGMDEYLGAMLAMAEARGKRIGVPHAEGFRQHLGHGYPQDDILAAELGTLVRRPGSGASR